MLWLLSVRWAKGVSCAWCADVQVLEGSLAEVKDELKELLGGDGTVVRGISRENSCTVLPAVAQLTHPQPYAVNAAAAGPGVHRPPKDCVPL